MSFKSIIQDMRGEFGSISRKGFDGRFSHGLRSRSHRVTEDSSVAVLDALKQSCWANMPPELLRDVLIRMEESECAWPSRKNVIACAGVCRSWREIMKEIVRNLEVSGNVTFPISLKQPGPRNTLINCFIKRNRGTHTYHLYLNLSPASNDDGKFLLAARRFRRPTYTDYIISLNADDIFKGSTNYIGKLRSNFFGTKFVIYDAQPPNAGAKVTKSHSSRLVGMRQVSPRVPAGNYTVAHVSYELNVLGSRGPRRMQCIMDAIPASATDPEGVAPTPTEFLPGNLDSFPSLPFFRSKSSRVDSFRSGFGPLLTQKNEKLVLKNKTPRWHDQLQCWCLNFNGRVTVASVKNFQLVASVETGTGVQEQENVILQFGKVGKDVFTMDYQYPISAFQAFAICLSSFDTKIACAIGECWDAAAGVCPKEVIKELNKFVTAACSNLI